MLPKYYIHVGAYENTLITKFFGLHCITLKAGRKVISLNNNIWSVHFVLLKKALLIKAQSFDFDLELVSESLIITIWVKRKKWNAATCPESTFTPLYEHSREKFIAGPCRTSKY